MGKEETKLVAVNASVLIAIEGHTPVIRMSHLPTSFYVIYVYIVRFANSMHSGSLVYELGH
jgi:hypothetical protein